MTRTTFRPLTLEWLCGRELPSATMTAFAEPLATDHMTTGRWDSVAVSNDTTNAMRAVRDIVRDITVTEVVQIHFTAIRANPEARDTMDDTSPQQHVDN
jgi:hypothetical protein